MSSYSVFRKHYNKLEDDVLLNMGVADRFLETLQGLSKKEVIYMGRVYLFNVTPGGGALEILLACHSFITLP